MNSSSLNDCKCGNWNEQWVFMALNRLLQLPKFSGNVQVMGCAQQTVKRVINNAFPFIQLNGEDVLLVVERCDLYKRVVCSQCTIPQTQKVFILCLHQCLEVRLQHGEVVNNAVAAATPYLVVEY